LVTSPSVTHGNEWLENASPEEIIGWALEIFGADVVASSSFQTQSVPLLHIISQTCAALPILFVDTGYHFPETLQFRDALCRAWGLNVHTIGPALAFAGAGSPPAPCDPDRCCHLRKVAPMQQALRRYRAWITGIRRDQTVHRRGVRVLEPQPGGLLKINPLAHWTRQDAQAYIRRHNLPAHPLYRQGYRSVGCAPCTRPVMAGDDERAGRWAGRNKTECGLHGDTTARFSRFRPKKGRVSLPNIRVV